MTNRRQKLKKVSPYKRLELELGYARAALSDAAAQYTRTVQALADLFAYYDRRDSGNWTAADVKKLARLREIAEGK